MRFLGCKLQQVVDVVVRYGVTFRWLTRLGTPGAFRVDGCLDKVEYGRLLLVDVTVNKQLISIRFKPIAVEAFGRHLKRVDASALCLFGCKIRPVKTYISIGKRRNSGCFFLLACNFTDAHLLGSNSQRILCRGLTATVHFLRV